MGKHSLYLAPEKVRDIIDTSHNDGITYTATDTATPPLGLLPALPINTWPCTETPHIPQNASSSTETRLLAAAQNFTGRLPDDLSTCITNHTASSEPHGPQFAKMALIVDKHRPRSLDDLTFHDELSKRLRSLV